MPLIFGGIVPHGDVIPTVPAAARAAKTTAAMQEIGRRLEAAQPDVVVVITPHGIRVDGAMAIALSERAAGKLYEALFPGDEAQAIQVDFTVDRDFACAIQAAATVKHVPTAMVHYGATSGRSDCYPLDWGAVVPLWFLGAHFAHPPQVIPIVPSRDLPLEALVQFGRTLATAAAATQRRIALVASSDLAHAHQVSGPYGYDPAARQFDAWIELAVKEDDLLRLLHPDMNLVEHAKPDGLWQILVLAGALAHSPLRGEFLSYEVPAYYGMLCAVYR